MIQHISTNYIVNEYLLIIKPSNDVTDKITALKKVFAEKYKCPQAVYSKPHSTLLKFKQLNINEHKIVQQLQKTAEQFKPIKVDLNGFGSFPSHTIYINIATQNSIVELVKSFRAVQSFLKLDKENKPHFITTPHITVSKKLMPWQYENAWLEYSNTNFTESFIATNLVLLKRNEQQKFYTVVTKFDLLGKKTIAAEQVSLF